MGARVVGVVAVVEIDWVKYFDPILIQYCRRPTEIKNGAQPCSGVAGRVGLAGQRSGAARRQGGQGSRPAERQGVRQRPGRAADWRLASGETPGQAADCTPSPFLSRGLVVCTN